MSIIVARYAGRCAKCQQSFPKGATVDHRGTKRTYHPACAQSLAPEAPSINLTEENAAPATPEATASEVPSESPRKRRGGPAKVRVVTAVSNVEDIDGREVVTVHFADGNTARHTDLARPELKAAVDHLFPGNGARTRNLTNEGLRNALVRRSLEGAVSAAEAATTVDGTVDLALLERLVAEAVRAEVATASLPTVITINDVAASEVRPVEGATHVLLPDLIDALDCGLNVLLVGPAGSGKSTLAIQAFSALGLETESVSFGPTTPTSKLFGYNDANGTFQGTGFFRSFHLGEAGFLADELDNGHPGLLAELNQALAGSSAAFACGQRSKHARHRLVATANTFGRGPDRLFVGRNVLDAATLDRFVTIEVPVDEDLELKAALGGVAEEHQVAAARWVDRVRRARAQAEARNLAVVISPRASIDGAKLIAKGWPEDKVADRRLFAGIKPDVRGLIDV